MIIVGVIASGQDDVYSTASPELVPLSFVFDDENEAQQFFEHVRDLYGLPAIMVTSSIDTYDSAIQALVEAVGPRND